MSAVAETRVGIVQYFPEEPVVGDSIGWLGEYLQLQIDVLAPLVKPGTVVLEIGAGVGMHTLALAARVGDAGHLFVVEPRPLYRRLLRQNLGANRVGNFTMLKGVDAGETIDDLRLEKLDWLKVNEGSDGLAIARRRGTDALAVAAIAVHCRSRRPGICRRDCARTRLRVSLLAPGYLLLQSAELQPPRR